MSSPIPESMTGMVYLGDRQVELRKFTVPKPGRGQVLLKSKASSLCGSDLHAIYRLPANKWSKDQEGYFEGVIGGHEPAGEVVQLGEGVENVQVGDRCVVFHITGCYNCPDCRELRPGSCTTPMDVEKGLGRRSHGWQRDGGHANYILCDAMTLIKMSPFMTYLDAAMVACGYGTAYSAVMKMRPNGHDRVLVVGLGPVGLAISQICQKLGAKVFGYEIIESRKEFARSLGIQVLEEDQVEVAEDGVAPRHIGYDFTFDVTGVPAGRIMAVRGARRWGTVMMIGGYNDVTLKVSPWIIQKQLTIRGSWVCSIPEMEACCKKLEDWQLHPDALISHTFPLSEAETAYKMFDEGKANKVAIVFD